MQPDNVCIIAEQELYSMLPNEPLTNLVQLENLEKILSGLILVGEPKVDVAPLSEPPVIRPRISQEEIYAKALARTSTLLGGYIQTLFAYDWEEVVSTRFGLNARQSMLIRSMANDKHTIQLRILCVGTSSTKEYAAGGETKVLYCYSDITSKLPMWVHNDLVRVFVADVLR